jgi:DNA/RNA-binding domain of Phe-tRNA-synthetase-like protein
MRMMPPYEVRYQLSGWEIFFAELSSRGESSSLPSLPSLPSLDELRAAVAEKARRELRLETLSSHPPVAALRRLFKQAGCDPSRYRPASEALLRRILKGEEIPAIHPLVDVNNCLSATLAVPCCVMAEGSFEPPFSFRSGGPGESYESLRGPFSLEGKPLLVDARGPCDAPITGSERVKVKPETERATLVVYLPKDVVTTEEAFDALENLLSRSRVVSRLDES